MPQIDHAFVPYISVVIPVYNGSPFLEQCLKAVFCSDFSSFEVIVIDDHSTDGSAAIARRFPCTVLESDRNGGPAAARNTGAADACGAIFFFLDADILVERDTLSLIAATMEADPELAALFGSYGRKTVPGNFVSRYKNLVHHYTHQHSREEAHTFCSGFGAIRREAFQRLGGFDPDCRFLEDIELGYRMSRAGLRVRLCRNLQMTHCKQYTVGSLIRSDLLGRAIPWTRLILETGIVRNDLNTRWNNVLSVPIAFLLLVSPALPRAYATVPVLACALILLNAGLLSLTYAEGGILFALQSCFLCWLGYIYSGAGVILVLAGHWASRAKVAASPASDPSES
jgi:GT2 family glycosyltransferase